MATKKDKKLAEDRLVLKRILALRDVVGKFVSDYNPEQDCNEVTVRLETLDKINKEFHQVLSEVEMNDDPGNFEEHIAERTDFENLYCRLKGFLLSKRDTNHIPLSSTMSSTFTTPHNSSSFHHRLPKIDLPRFSGDESRWISFRDNFVSMIHSNDDIPTVNKLQYLLQALDGDAKKPFESVDIQADNYASTWDALMKRYDNKRFLKKELFRGLFELPVLKRESAVELNALVDDFQRHVKALGKLGEPIKHWDTPLIYILCNKLDSSTLRAWENETRQSEDVKYDELVEFLVQQIRMLKSVSNDLHHRSHFTGIKVAGSCQKKSVTANAIASESKSANPAPQCYACPQKHLLYQCHVFAKFSISKRRELISQKGLCWNCFRPNHTAKFCKSKFSCRVCQAKHHSLLHDPVAQARVPQATVNKGYSAHQSAPTTSHNTERSGLTNPPEVSLPVQATRSTVLLETIVLSVVDKYGKEIPVRALLDSAAMSNFITKKLANALATRQSVVDIEVAGIGESVKQIKRQISATIKSRISPYSTTLEFLVMKKPTANLPTIPINTTTWRIPNVPLADPHFYVPGIIDVVIGGEFYHEFHTGHRKPIGDGLPYVVETLFGWTVSGKVANACASLNPTCYLSTVDQHLESALEKFWDLESVAHVTPYSTEEKACETLYAKTTTRTHSGRYVVRLPRAEDPQVTLGESLPVAIRRFYSLERRLQKDLSMKLAYQQFMDEYIRLDHMRKLNYADVEKPHCYLPHHPIFKETSTTTKVRVVFDASCKSSSGFSLNDTLLVGPVVQQDLLSIILRFRTYPVAFVADIEKMYRQIEVHPGDQSYQRILWRSSPEEPLCTYELRTVTYGTASAPYLATRTLLQVSQDEGSFYPVAVEAVQEDFYVDDLLSGAKDVNSAIIKRRQITAMLASAQFPLRKWASNRPEALVDVPLDDLAILPIHDLQNNSVVSTLGLVWDTQTDVLRFNVQLPLPAVILTKRKVISYIAQIFDPLGLVGPVIASTKIFMQRLWKLKTEANHPYDWDKPLPPKLQDEWKKFHAMLHMLSELQIPRFVLLEANPQIQLHLFSDASESAYGACCFVRSETADCVKVQLLTSKSKVAPLATKHSIARLELCAAVLSTKLLQKVKQSTKLQAEIYLWTDSTTVLQWLNSAPNRWKTFVANRISSIQTSTVGYMWRHVPGVENPADELSRGLSPTELLNRHRWWHGPPWLSKSPDCWPHAKLPDAESASTVKEARKVTLVVLTPNSDAFAEYLFNRFSTYSKLRCAVAYCFKYFDALRVKVRTPNTDNLNTLSTVHFKAADRALARLAQQQSYHDEISDLSRSVPISTPPLKWLKPYRSSDGLIRVGGRLGSSNVSQDSKHPIILSAKHPLTRMLADYYHKQLLHAGPQLMLSTMRQRYWIIGGRNLARQTYHRCIKCFRTKPILIQQSMADLPKSRVTAIRPFAISGVDYCGPLYLKSPVRNRAPAKAYIAIFVCFSTKAVHIELVSDLTTPAFLAALRRFSSRRGRIQELHSDNATTFKGAANELRRIYEMLKVSDSDRKQIINWCAEQEIKFKFIPPRAPHFGGLWEAAVKSCKHHLLREIGNTSLTQEDMLTLLTQIEMCLNSRPLTPIPSESTDLEALTPGHFLTGSNLQSVPDVDRSDTPDNRLDHWQRTQRMLQRIWARWYPEYLAQLQTRAKKGCSVPVKIDIGRIVVIKDENLPPANWPLGRITKLYPGKDGIVRVVSMKTANADNVVRPASKIALLPIGEEADEK